MLKCYKEGIESQPPDCHRGDVHDQILRIAFPSDFRGGNLEQNSTELRRCNQIKDYTRCSGRPAGPSPSASRRRRTPRHAASVSQLGAIQSEAGKMLARKDVFGLPVGRPRPRPRRTVVNMNRLSIWRGISNKKQREEREKECGLN